MRSRLFIGLLGLFVLLAACHRPTLEGKRLVRRAERLADSMPDSALRLIDSMMQTPLNFTERQRMDMALLQGEILFRNASFDDVDFLDSINTYPELERAAAYFAQKKQYAKAAHAALYSGLVQQYFHEKDAAMRSFKEAEGYGKHTSDSLTIALAEYWMGKTLYYDGRKQEALSSFKVSESFIGKHYAEHAYIENGKAVVYILLHQNDSAKDCLIHSLEYAEKENSNKVKLKTLNNFAVFYRLQGNYDKAIASLRQIEEGHGLDDAERLMLYLNLGNVFFNMKEADSAAKYYQRLEVMLPNANVKKETVLSVHEAFSQFAESQNDTPMALQYRKKHEKYLYDVMIQRQEQTTYRIQQQYDYESLQNEMRRELIRKRFVITLLGIIAIIGLASLAISQIRLAKTRKEEEETKANLFLFMKQNKELLQRNEEQEQTKIYLTQKHRENVQAYEDLLKEKERLKETTTEYGEKLSFALKREQTIMLRLHLFLKNQGDDELLKKLEKSVFGKKSHIEAMMENVDCLYPHLRKTIKKENLGLDENEQMDVILSYFNVSRQDEALLLDKSTDMVDKIRNSSRKKIRLASKGNMVPKTK